MIPRQNVPSTGLSLEEEPSNRGVMVMNMMEIRMTRTKAEEDRPHDRYRSFQVGKVHQRQRICL